MPHRNPVTHGNRRKYNRGTPRHRHAHLDGVYNLIKVHMSRHDLVVGTDNPHERAVKFLLCHAERVKEGTVRCLLHPLGYGITSHIIFLLLFCRLNIGQGSLSLYTSLS